MDYPLRTPDQLEPILKAFRKGKGLSQLDISRKLGISQQAYSLLEAAPHRASVERLLTVLAALDVDVVLHEKTVPAPRAPGEW